MEDGKIRTQAVEFAAADHCNLRCAGCSHMSPFLEARLPEEQELLRDMSRLATVLLADEIRIVGGEPLLNPRIVDILKAAKQSAVAKRVILATNGLRLHMMPNEFWGNVDELRLNLYPDARPTEQLVTRARERAAASGITLDLSEYSTFRVTMVTEPHPADATTRMIFRTCKNAHLYHCHLVRAGWLYKCACPAYLGEFRANLGGNGYQAEQDGFNIHAATGLREQLWSFLTSDVPLEACRHCLGYVGHTQVHHQLSLSEARSPAALPISRQTHLSKTTFAREALDYYGRRIAERITGRGRW